MFQPAPRWESAHRIGSLLTSLWLCLMGMPSGHAFAQEGSSAHYDVWNVGQEALEQNPVTAVVQTDDGFLWLGTYTGLVRFDGVRLRVFDSANTPGLRNSRITALYRDPEGALWIGHESGEVSRFTEGEFGPADQPVGWPGGTVEAITSDENDDLWLLNHSGLLVRNRDGLTIEPPGGSSASRKVSISRESTGRLWVVANGKAATLNDGRLVPFAFDDVSGTSFFQRVVPARDGGLWVFVGSNLRKWREGRWSVNLGDCPWESGYLTELLETRSGMLLVGTVRNGVYLLRAGAETLHFSRTNGLSHDWVRALCEDHEGNIWLATGAGLTALRPRKVQMLNSPDAWQGRAVLSFSVGHAGETWVGTEGAGLYHKEGDQWTRYTESSGITNLFVWSVMRARSGELFVGTWGGGLLTRNGDTFAPKGSLSGITDPVVALYEGRKGEIWIGTTLGLHRYESGDLTWSADSRQLVSPNVRTITESPDGTVWFGMLGGGLGRVKDGVVKQFRKKDGLGSDAVLALYMENDGTLWIGTSDNGLCRLKDGRFKTISTAQGLMANIISQIADDGAGNLWMGSHQGILRVSKRDLSQCADGLISSVRCLSYGKAEGLASQKCSGGFQPAVGQTSDGRLWFPTTLGLAIIDPRSLTTNSVPPPVVIEEMIVQGNSVKVPRALASTPAGRPAVRIPAGNQRFEIRYTALSFTAPDKVRFKYKLEGLESEWVEADTKRFAQYSYLRPGTYTFRVMACNNDDIWNEQGASLAFQVLPFFWQTWWFKSVLVLITGGLVAWLGMWIAKARVRRHLEQLERQRALERERARIARDIHDDLGSSLTRISLLSQSARAELEDGHVAASDLDQIYATARELTRAMDEIVWAVNPQHDSLDSLAAYLGRFAQNFLAKSGISCRLDLPLHLSHLPLSSETRHNIFLAFKEALNNVVKHASASEVRISLEMRPEAFVLVVSDNGRGFSRNGGTKTRTASEDNARLAAGNGLSNMRNRMEDIGGSCEWDTAPGEGTRAKLMIPQRKELS